MKKPHKHDELSDIICAEKGCTRRIKKNVVDRKPKNKNLKCFRHFMVQRRADQNVWKERK